MAKDLLFAALIPPCAGWGCRRARHHPFRHRWIHSNLPTHSLPPPRDPREVLKRTSSTMCATSRIRRSIPRKPTSKRCWRSRPRAHRRARHDRGLNKIDAAGGRRRADRRPGTPRSSGGDGPALTEPAATACCGDRAASARDRQVATYRLGHDRGGDIAWLYQHGEVLERHDDEAGASLTVRLSADDRRRFETSRPVLQS